MKKNQKSRLKMEEINFEPRDWTRKLLVFVFAYVMGIGYFCLIIISKLIGNGNPPWENVVRIIFFLVIYIFVALFILFYGVFAQNRFRFEETGVKVLTWRGWQFYKWKSIETAFLTDIRTSVDLVVKAKGRYLVIPLTSFKRSETLFREIVKRIDVYISATERHMRRITEPL